MSAALGWSHPQAGGWTANDLDAMPDDGQRHEILDGALIVVPSHGRIHQTIAMRLGAALEAECPRTYDVTQAVQVRLDNRLCLVPDVLVLTAAAAARDTSHYQPHEVVLAVEIVSTASQTMDRVTKPALYARAGIPFYWRVEIEDGDVVVHTYKIDPVHEAYQATGRWTKYVDTDEPWPINLPVSRITPRHLWVAPPSVHVARRTTAARSDRPHHPDGKQITAYLPRHAASTLAHPAWSN